MGAVIIHVLNVFLVGFLGLLMLYFLRHFIFSLNRAFREQRLLYVGMTKTRLPTVTVFIPCHNEERVIAGACMALVKQEYPASLFKIVPINDRSTDGTAAILDRLAEQFPDRIVPFHRNSGQPGKSAALKEACSECQTDAIVVFDADYLPTPQLLKSLVSPFTDPEVGAVMGRVVPINVERNTLTRMLDLERSAGYQVDQQARMNLGLLPQYGGTVGSVRMQALREIGGWQDHVLAEDTDLSVRLYLKNWHVVYQNTAECYEEVPEDWAVRIRQIRRWAKGHNQVFFSQWSALSKNKEVKFFEKLDASLLLAVYVMGPITFIAWSLAQVLYYTGYTQTSLIVLSAIMYLLFSSLGNFALFFEIGTAAFLDGYRRRILLLPLGALFFFVSLLSVSESLLIQLWEGLMRRKTVHWDKTERYREVPPA